MLFSLKKFTSEGENECESYRKIRTQPEPNQPHQRLWLGREIQVVEIAGHDKIQRVW